MKLRNRLLVLLLPLLVASQSAALTLGRVRGVAIVGQSLDVSVQIQLNADESATALCLEADVFHADARQDAGRVRVTIEPTAQANTVNSLDQRTATSKSQRSRSWLLIRSFAWPPCTAWECVSTRAGSINTDRLIECAAFQLPPDKLRPFPNEHHLDPQ